MTAGSCTTTRAPTQVPTNAPTESDVHSVCQEFKPEFRLPGASIYGTQRISTNAEDGPYRPGYCARLCEADPVCKAWAFDTSGNTCTFGNTAEIIPCVMGTGNCGNTLNRMTAGSCTTTRDTQTSCVTSNPEAIHVTDTSTVGRQWYPIVEKLADGRLVVAWDDLGTNDNMFRIYSSSLTPLTGPIAFNRGLTMQSTWGWQARESVRALPSGGFVMLVSGADIGATFANGRFEMKIFDASLNPTASTIFGANNWGEPSRALMEPKIALLSSGFMVTFRIGNCGMTWSCHAAQIFDASLNPVGTWFYVDGRVRGGDEGSPAVLNLNGGPWSGHVVTSVSLPNGNVMLIHSGMNAATAGTTSASIWDASGNIVKAHFLIPDVIANRAHQSDHYADAALLSNGNVVVAWTRWQRENADGTGRDQRQLLFQILDQDGNKIGSNQRSWGPMESTGDATITVGGYVMVASTEGKFTISSNPGYNVYTRMFLNDGSINGAIVNELEGLASSLASRAVIEYGSHNYVIAVKGGRIDNIADAQDGVFLIGKTCADSTMSSTLTPTAEPSSAPTLMPSFEPTKTPTLMPSFEPTKTPTSADVHSVCQEFKPEFRLPGASIYGTQRISTNAEDGPYRPGYCARLCEADPVCKAWAFDTSGNTCTFGNTAQIIPCVMG